MEEKKLKHLELTQGVVNRLANNSALLKGWSVTLVAALLALSVATEQKIAFIWIALVPLIVFWILDAYYLWQERLFRAVYDNVRQKNEDDIDFEMNPQQFVSDERTWSATFWSTTLRLFYLSLIVTMFVVIGVLSSQTTTSEKDSSHSDIDGAQSTTPTKSRGNS